VNTPILNMKLSIELDLVNFVIFHEQTLASYADANVTRYSAQHQTTHEILEPCPQLAPA
jgi:hypothetical protein